MVKPEPLEWYAMVRTTNTDNSVNQSELETEIYNWRQARENIQRMLRAGEARENGLSACS